MANTAANQEREMQVAVERVVGFAQEFGEAHLNLACHAAFPLSLTPDLLYQIWANFVPEAPWTAVARVLLSRLCKQVGSEMYEMDNYVRNLLLRELKEQFGQERFDSLGELLLEYVSQRLTEDDPDTQDLRQAQEWTALAYTKPEPAARELARVLSEKAQQEDIGEVLRLSSLLETLSEPLVDAGFEPLLVYGQGMKSYFCGDLENANIYLGKLFQQNNKISVAGINLQIPDTKIYDQVLKNNSPDGNQVSTAPVVLVILSGWGYREETQDNAIAIANTPIFDSLTTAYPSTLISASGKDVGLPDGQMGNHEVAFLNIGAGRIVPQELVRITNAIEDGSLFENEVLVETCDRVRASGGQLHFIGLCSEGGVHSHLKHLLGLLDLAKINGISDVCVHAITDGRDTSPTNGIKALDVIEKYTEKIGVGRIVTMSGRYYAMDRDRQWDRIQKAYEVMTQDSVMQPLYATEVLQNFYNENLTDEFIPPTRIAPGAIKPEDGVVFFNYRPDRARQLTYAFVQEDFTGFERKLIQPLNFVTFTQYDPSLAVEVVFKPQNLTNTLGEVIAAQSLRQFRIAETEKYPHITYFFNAGLESPFEGEDRELIQSPMVVTFDRAPAMSAIAVTNSVCQAINKEFYSLIVVNYANGDLVGHTGNLDAAVTAIETVDQCIGTVVAAANKARGTVIITGDNGNAEYMKDAQGNPWTEHTTNPVPFILIEGKAHKIVGHGGNPKLREDGRLADIAPTILHILGIPQPEEMTGRSMIQLAEYVTKKRRAPVRINLD